MQKVAEKAAYLHVVAQLHKNGSLRRAYARLGKQQKPHENVSDEALAKERSPKYDVYEYAARFLSAPKFYHHVERPSVQQNDNPIFKTILELPEQGIRVEGIGRSVHDSETASCLRFFKRANRLEENSRCIKGDVPLRLTDAKKFWEWYRLQHPETKFALEGPRHAGQEGLLRAQVLMDGKPLGKTVELSGDAGEESQIELVAYLTAAIELQKNDIDLFSRYLNENRNKDGQVLRLNSPIQIGIDAESTGLMDAAIHRIPESQLPSKVEALTALESRAEKKSPRKSQQALRSLVLRRKLDAFNSRPEYTELRMKKAQLPMNHCRNQLIGMMEKNTYGIVMGAAGCGKTTQVPQILLEHAIVNDVGAECNIICTQPRRIAAISIARRVANERGEHLQESVGYQIRMDSKLPRQTGSIAYCTTGILLVRLQQDLDDILDNYSHLVIDEAHERDIDIDFLLTVLKRAIEERLSKGRKVPKVVLMSATIDTELFARYFQGRLPGGEAIDCPILNVPGRMFPVVERYFEDIWDMLQRDYPDQLGFLHKHDQISEYIEHERQFSHGGSLVSMVSRTRSLKTSSEVVGAISTDLQAALSGSDYSDASSVEKQDSLVPIALAAAVLAHLVRTTDQGAILVFLPGLDEILRLDQCLRVDNPLGVDFQDASKFKILLLHSRIQNADQSKVFDSVPEGCRKIILATNIAETSVTIPNVRFVVDTGKARERYYDHTREIAKLQCTWISKSSSTQRAGRAGRVQDGYYYALFSKSRRQNMRATGVPEMLHSDLQRVCLNVKALGFKVSLADFLAGAIEPPAPAAVEHAIQRLQNLEAVTDNEELTPLGRLLTLL